MEGASGAGGTTGPAPFLLKTYDMVDDTSTDDIVSWSSSNNSFVVWNPPEFARLLLPTYFKHNNFSSFIRQLNTYGFRKIDPEKWEFANDDFVKDQKHLLKNIHRRKPIHSHSQPQGSVVDPDRALFEEEIERLSRDKATLEAKVLRSNQQRSAGKQQLEDLTHKIDGLEKRQEKLLTFLEKAVQNPSLAQHLARKVESMDFSAYNKKRRLPQADHSQPVMQNSFGDNHSISKSDSGTFFHQDFSNKLRLELSPTISDVNLLSHSTQSSNEDGESPEKNLSEGEFRGAQTSTESLPFATEMLELSDAGTSFTLKMDSSLSRKVSHNESQRFQSLQRSGTYNKEGDSHISCHLNLTLASSPLQVDRSAYSAGTPQQGQENGKSAESRLNSNNKECDIRDFPKNGNLVNEEKTLSSEPQNNSQGPPAAPVRVNDVFWEQFLTERPGCSDNEEASSSYRANSYDEGDDGMSVDGMSRNRKNIERLSL